MNGILPVWKEAGITSFDVIRKIKRAVHPDFKIGHGGTLDPFAEGVLLLLLGKGTKQMESLSQLPKTYIATAKLGAGSDTLDVTGEISDYKKPIFTEQHLTEIAKKFMGEIMQEIPEYSAAKVNGVPRYKLARQGKAIERKSKMVTIYDLKFIRVNKDEVEFEVTVSSGTYIRQLSYDIFKSLGIESYLTKLVRIKIGDFSQQKCMSMSDFETGEWRDKVLPL